MSTRFWSNAILLQKQIALLKFMTLLAIHVLVVTRQVILFKLSVILLCISCKLLRGGGVSMLSIVFPENIQTPSIEGIGNSGGVRGS